MGKGKTTISPELLLDPRWYIETFLWIRTKDKRVVPFRFNRVQRDFVSKLLPRRDSGLRGLREVVLKGRQHGFTTLILALFYHDTITNEGTNTMIVPHRREDAEEMLETVKLFYAETPEQFRPVIHYNSTYRMTFPGLRSQITIASGSKGVGRSRTIHNLLVSELPSWKDAENDLAPLLETVPKTGNVIIESTPGPRGDEFYRIVEEARKGHGVFRLHEYPWWWNPEYALPLEPGETLEPHTDDEAALIAAHGLTPEQIKWRREKIATIGPQKFAQEYECDFARSGRMVFDATALKRYEVRAQAVVPIEPAEVMQSLAWRRMERAHMPPAALSMDGWRVYELPQAGVQYVIGADVAEGLAGGDFDAAVVMRKDNGRVAAVLHGQWAPAVYAAKLYGLGRFYGDALLAVERNNHGHAVLLKLREWQYPALAWWDGRPGWITNGQTKPVIIDRLEEAIRQEWIDLLDRVAVEELFSFVYHDDGTMAATAGAHDDLVMALAITWFIRQVAVGVKGDEGGGVRVIG